MTRLTRRLLREAKPRLYAVPAAAVSCDVSLDNPSAHDR